MMEAINMMKMIKSGKLTNTKAIQPFLPNEMVIIITLKQENG